MLQHSPMALPQRTRVHARDRRTGRKFGDATNPLLVSVRSGARASMPGMMDTVPGRLRVVEQAVELYGPFVQHVLLQVLNLGLNNTTAEAGKSG